MADVPLPEDPLAENVNVEGVEPVVDTDIAAQSLDQLDVAFASDQFGTNLKEIAGEPQSAVDVANAIDQLADALASNGTDELRITTDAALDVSAATVTVTDDGSLVLDAANQGTLPTEQQSPVGVEDSSGSQVDPATEDSLTSELSREIATWSAGVLDVSTNLSEPLDVSSATVTVTDDGSLVLDAASQGTLPTEQQTPVGVEDASGTQLDPVARQDASPVTGSTSAAGTDVTLTLGDYRRNVDFFVDVSGSATLTVEVRTSGGSWRTFDTVDYSSGTTEVEQYDTAFAEIRASVDTNLNALEGSAKGV